MQCCLIVCIQDSLSVSWSSSWNGLQYAPDLHWNCCLPISVFNLSCCKIAPYRVNLEAGRKVKTGSIGLLLHDINRLLASYSAIYIDVNICISTKRGRSKRLRFVKKIPKKFTFFPFMFLAIIRDICIFVAYFFRLYAFLKKLLESVKIG